MKYIVTLVLFLYTTDGYTQASPYKEDFNYFWNTIHDNYAYFNKKKIDWDKVKAIYAPQFDTVSSRNSFISVIEQVFYELYDHHCSLNTNTPLSRRLVPTGADIWAEYVNDRPVIAELRIGFGAEKSGMMPGMEIIAINDIPVEKAIAPFLAHSTDPEAKNYALRLALAGDHQTIRKLSCTYRGKTTNYYPDKEGMQLENIHYHGMLESRRYGSTAYIRINNCLFDNGLIAAFDSVLNDNLNTSALILDLRETASGGNSSVARAILGRFITKDAFYQKHELYAEEKETGVKRSWQEIVSPRGPTYTKRLIVLADHWTGSMGEGITIGFDGMKRATVIGTPLARLIGATETFQMPNTKIRFSFPTERLYHVNGQPRELYEPTIKIDVSQQSAGKDLALIKALSIAGAK
jgi:carboxyl-terminal processing protease